MRNELKMQHVENADTSEVVLLQKSLVPQTSTVFVNPESGLVVFDVTPNSKAFRLIGIYAPCARMQQIDFYRHLED